MSDRPESPEDIYPERVLSLDRKLAYRVWWHLSHDKPNNKAPYKELLAVCACTRPGLNTALSDLEDNNIVESEWGHEGDGRERVLCLTDIETKRLPTESA